MLFKYDNVVFLYLDFLKYTITWVHELLEVWLRRSVTLLAAIKEMDSTLILRFILCLLR